jgi:hypothetical protein
MKMPVLNEAELLFLGDVPISDVYYGESRIWPPPAIIDSCEPGEVIKGVTTVVTVGGQHLMGGTEFGVLGKWVLRGEWDRETSYLKKDSVVYNDVAYIATEDIPGSYWSPSIDMELWFEADDLGLTDGAQVMNWPSKGIRTDVTVAATATPPTYVAGLIGGKGAVRISTSGFGSGSVYAPTEVSEGMGFFAVARRGGSDWPMLTVYEPNGYELRCYQNTGQPEVVFSGAPGAGAGSTVVIPPDTPFLLNCYFTPTELDLWMNGTLLIRNPASGTFTPFLPASAELHIGERFMNSSPWVGEIAAVGICSGVLSVDLRQRIEAGMAWRYGLQDLLPTDHPYKGISPGEGGTPDVDPRWMLFDAAWIDFDEVNILSGSQVECTVPANLEEEDYHIGFFPATNTDRVCSDIPLLKVYVPLPVIESLEPSSATSTANVALTVNGSNFVAGGFVWWVDAKTPTAQPFGSAYSFYDSTRVTTTLHHLKMDTDFLVWVASDPNGTGPDWVGGPVSNQMIFSITQPPLHIDHIDPVTGPPESQVLDIYGTGFLPVWTGSTPYSTVGAYALDDFFSIGESMIFIDSTHIQVPDFWPVETDYQIVVINHSASGPVIEESNTALFTCVAPIVPVLTSLTPNTGQTDWGTIPIHVYGSGFVPGSYAECNGGALYSQEIVDEGHINVTAWGVPTTPMIVSFVVKTPDGLTSNALSFTVTDPSVVAPILNSIDPASAPPGPLGRAFNTYGSKFVSGADILFDGVPTVNKATFINEAMLSTNLGSEVDVPGTKQVTVRNPDGTVSNAMPFTVTGPPIVVPILNSISPTRITQAQWGMTVNATGSGFLPGIRIKADGVDGGGSTASTDTTATFALGGAITNVPGVKLISVYNTGSADSNTLEFTVNPARTRPT